MQSTELLARLKQSPMCIEDAQGIAIQASQIHVARAWRDALCTASITNVSDQPIHLGNIVLFDLSPHGINPATPIFAEGFQMLSYTVGTLGNPIDWDYKDREHYRIPEPDGLRTAYGMMTLRMQDGESVLLAFPSCKRFLGRFSFDATRLRISLDPEGLALGPGDTWNLELFLASAGPERNRLLDRLAQEIQANHPLLRLSPPTGWCSWYCYGDAATRPIVQENMQRFKQVLPELKYIQIDDGYSPCEGDWLDPNPAFGDLDASMAEIRMEGFEPALWVAPFIAEQSSRVLREHPDWFVQGADGKPLNSATVGFAGWRHGPWYVLDGTNPHVQSYFETLFQTMRERWGIHYFKLDANYWGAIHGGTHYDPNATRIEAYRRGMEAVLRGAGPDSVVLGCNAPLWPSFGVVNAMRTSDDIGRDWQTLAHRAKMNFERNWMNGRLWVNDPDAVVLAGAELPPNSLFHATAIHAVGGSILSGDKAMDLTPEQVQTLHKLLQPTGKGAVFPDDRMEVGVTDLGATCYYYCFNYDDIPADRTIHLLRPAHLRDFWTGADLGVHAGDYSVPNIPGRSARLIIAAPGS